MKIKIILLILCAIALMALAFFGYNWFGKSSGNSKNKYEGIETSWMKHVNSYIGNNKSGKFEAMDKERKPVIFECEKVLFAEEAFDKNMREIADIWAIEIAEIDFIDMKEAQPEQLSVIFEDMAKKYGEKFQKFIKAGAIKKNEQKGTFEILDWELAKKIHVEGLKLFVSNFRENKCVELDKCSLENIAIFVKAKEKETKKLIGYALFSIGKDTNELSVGLDNIALESKSQGRGLGKLLISSIFKILPEIKQISLGVYFSNKKAISVYEALGFVARPKSWVEGDRDFIMDYLVEKSNRLQDAAKSLRLVRETIFDKVVNIPKELVLDIPKLPPLCDEIKDLKKGFVDVGNGGKLYYEQEGVGISQGKGKGITLVLINGGPGGTHQGFHPYFSQIKDYANIIYYDQRGTGKSSADDTCVTYTIKQAVQDLENLRKALKIEKWAMLGWSYGGLLAQCYAITYPENVTGLILVASSSGLAEPLIKPEERREKMFISQAEQDAIENIQKKVKEGKIATDAQVIYNQNICGHWKRFSYNKPTLEEIIRMAFYGWAPAKGFEELMRAESDKINLKGKFDDFEIPTLVIEAKWDLLWWNPDRATFMRKNHPHAQVQIFEKSGHNIFADEPDKFFSMLKSFLEKSSKAKIAYKQGNRLIWPK